MAQSSRFRPYDRPPAPRAEVIDIALAHGTSVCVRFGDVLCQDDPTTPAAVVVPAYAGGKVLAAAVGRYPQLCPAFTLADNAPEALAVALPEATATPVVVFTRYTRRTGAAFVTAHWAAIARAAEGCVWPPAGAGTDPGRIGVLRAPAFGVQNGVTFYEASRYLLYGAVAFLQDGDLRGAIRRIEIVLGPHGERVFEHIERLAGACGVPPLHACIVCSTFPRNVVSEPCGHWAVCSSCLHLANARSDNGDRCLVCRQQTAQNRELLSADTGARAVWAPCGHACPDAGATACPVCASAGGRVAPFFSAS